MRSRRLLLPVLLGATLALAGCSADSGGEYAEPEADRGVTVQEEAAEDSAAGPGGSPTAPMAGTREVIVTGYLTMTVEDPRASSAEVARIVEAAGGWVEARSERAGTEREEPTASLTVRIPSGALSQSLTQIEALGEVTQFDQNSEDVTMTVRDLDARIRAMEISVERLTTMLEQAATTQDVINAEQTLTDRQAQLEALQSQRAYLREQVAMSTLHVTLWTPADAPEPEPEREGFWGGLLKSWDAMVAAMGGEGGFDTYDVGADGITITEERGQNVDFSAGESPQMVRPVIRHDLQIDLTGGLHRVEQFGTEPRGLLLCIHEGQRRRVDLHAHPDRTGPQRLTQQKQDQQGGVKDLEHRWATAMGQDKPTYAGKP